MTTVRLSHVQGLTSLPWFVAFTQLGIIYFARTSLHVGLCGSEPLDQTGTSTCTVVLQQHD